MLLKQLVEKKRVVIKDRIESREDAIRIAAEPLLRDGTIKESYIAAMIDSLHEHGPYIVIAPNIAIPHARGEHGVNETSVSFLKVGEPVHFGDSPEHDASLIFVLASVDGHSHIELLQGMIEELSDEKIVSGLLEANSIDDVEKVINIKV